MVFWGTPKFRRGAKNCQENLIRRLCGTPMRSRGTKKLLLDRSEKMHWFLIKFRSENGRLGGAESMKICLFYNSFVVFAILGKGSSFNEKWYPKWLPNRCTNRQKSILGGQGGAKCRFRILLGLRWRKLIFSTIFEAVKIRQNLINFVFCSLLGARGACRPGQHGCGDGKRIFFESWLFFCCIWLVRVRKLDV